MARFCRRVDSQHAHLLLGQGFHAGDKDNEKEKYTAQVLTLRPTLYRQLIDHVYLGAGWSLAAQNADEMDHDDRPKIENTPQGPSVFSSGASIDINWDDRDFVPNPRRGQYANLRYTHYAPGLGSDTRFEEFQLHYSHYHALSEKACSPGRPMAPSPRARYRGA